MRIFIPNRKSTGRRGGNNRNIFIHDRFPNRTDIDISLFPSLFDKTIRNQRHPATFFFFQQPHPDPEGIHNLNEIFPQLRVIVIHITSMEITHLFRKSKLFFHLFLIPAFESSESIFRESTAMIDFQHSIQNRFYRCQSQRCMTSTGINGQGLYGLNYAACHQCALLPETSCAMRNLLLDRAALIGRTEDGTVGFFIL